MKKTLITLLALGGMASAANDFTVVQTTKGYVDSVSGLTFVIEDTDVLSESGYILAAFGTDQYTFAAGANVFKLSEDSTTGAITLSVGVGDIQNQATDGSILSTTTVDWFNETTRTKTFDTTLERGVVYTISGTGEDQSLTLNLTWGDVGSASVTYNGNMNGTSTSNAVAHFNQNYAVPEPTTATLSLLALAGLAARRRRK